MKDKFYNKLKSDIDKGNNNCIISFIDELVKYNPLKVINQALILTIKERSLFTDFDIENSNIYEIDNKTLKKNIHNLFLLESKHSNEDLYIGEGIFSTDDITGEEIESYSINGYIGLVIEFLYQLEKLTFNIEEIYNKYLYILKKYESNFDEEFGLKLFFYKSIFKDNPLMDQVKDKMKSAKKGAKLSDYIKIENKDYSNSKELIYTLLDINGNKITEINYSIIPSDYRKGLLLAYIVLLIGPKNTFSYYEEYYSGILKFGKINKFEKNYKGRVKNFIKYIFETDYKLTNKNNGIYDIIKV